MGGSRPGKYSTEEVEFLSLVADHLALAIDSALNLEASLNAQAELARKNDRLELVLDLTNRVVSNLELRDLLREVAAHRVHLDVQLVEPVQGRRDLPTVLSFHLEVHAATRHARGWRHAGRKLGKLAGDDARDGIVLDGPPKVRRACADVRGHVPIDR